MIVDCAHYKDGRRQHEGKLPLEVASGCVSSDEPGEFVWLGLFEPSAEELREIAARFDLHELAVEDAERAHQRPKLEDYDDSYFIVLKTARYDEEAEQVHFGVPAADWHVVVFLIVSAGVATIFFGLAPALQAFISVLDQHTLAELINTRSRETALLQVAPTVAPKS